MAFETLRPDGELSDVGLVANDETDHDEDPDVSSVTVNATGNDVNTEWGGDFPTPTSSPTTGLGRQEFRVGVQEFDVGQTGVPTARIEVFDNGSLVIAGPEVNVGPYSVISLRWDASLLTNLDGSTAQCKLIGTKSGGGAGVDNSVRIGHMEWNAVTSIDYFDLFWQALEARVSAVWTDIDIQFSGTQMKRVNWREAIKADDFKVPFVAYALSPARGIDTAGMANRTNAYDVTVFYIRSDEQTDAEKAGEILIEDSIEAKLKVLQDDLYPTPPDQTGFQVLKQPDIDISAANAVNAVFVEASAPFLAGALHVEFVIGETN